MNYKKYKNYKNRIGKEAYKDQPNKAFEQNNIEKVIKGLKTLRKVIFNLNIKKKI